ncbi:helix-turn-helix transcriptional regulator [Oceanihabitans sp. IOP_32]|uniref:helix-turn-helix domain-containing protein n=1 Tax=Oceanihabitans sp. IOP_32 TaxID=2529032 RepID=UPI0012934790|nr:helix-turn-helix transcriptional regulator [Oceanihabitans sp. IOP_32]QFZ55360.1 helix-turn-helix transcriptional regulator [Oceanihabitans sp. IOP_32]
MATFGEFLRKERENKGLNQSEFGQEIGIIMTDISKIENGRKKFPFTNLEKLAKFIEKDIEELKTLFVADILVDEVHKYNCSDNVFSVAEEQSRYVKSKNVKQGKLKL